MKKICVCVGYKSDYSYLKSVLGAIKTHPDLKLQLCVNSIHGFAWYDDFLKSIRNDGFRINYVINALVGTRTMTAMGQSIALGIIQYQTTFYAMQPDVVLVIGDRFETLSPVLAAAFHNIPIAHIGGGERTGTIDECTRYAVSRYANIHFVANDDAKERLIRSGEDPETIYVTGSPTTDILKRVDIKLNVGRPYIIVMQHPVTTEVKDAGWQITETLEALKNFDFDIFLWYPNIDGGSSFMVEVIDEFLEENEMPNLFLFNHIKFEQYVALLKYCKCLVGNSSSGMRESCYFGIPTVNIGTRQTNRLRGKNVVDVSYDKNEIQNAIETAANMPRFDPEELYGDGHTGEKIAEILAGYEFKTTQKYLTY